MTVQCSILPMSSASYAQAAEREKVFAAIKYEQSLAMLRQVRAEKLITPREYEQAKLLLHKRFFLLLYMN